MTVLPYEIIGGEQLFVMHTDDRGSGGGAQQNLAA
jgi:hypothetical protein